MGPIISINSENQILSYLWTNNATALWQTHAEQLSMLVQPVDDNFLVKDWYLKGSSHLDILNPYTGTLYCGVIWRCCIIELPEPLNWKLHSIFLQIKWKKQDILNTKWAQYTLWEKLQWDWKWFFPIYAVLHKMYGSGLEFNFMGNVCGFVRYFTWMHTCI